MKWGVWCSVVCVCGGVVLSVVVYCLTCVGLRCGRTWCAAACLPPRKQLELHSAGTRLNGGEQH